MTVGAAAASERQSVMPLFRASRISGRLYASFALLSTVALLVVGYCLVRTWRASDEYQIASWDPSNRTFTATRVRIDRGGILLHSDSTTALPSDNTAPLVAMAGPTNRRVVHRVWPAGPSANGPWLWTDHYRSTPSVGINTSGLSDCWTLEFRVETTLILFSIVPAAWTITSLRRWQKNRAIGTRGFAVMVPKVGETSPGGTAGA
jgi:hypothetical protein